MEKYFLKSKKLTNQDLKRIISLLKAGGIIIYPTETAYAIGGDACNIEVIKKIYSIKKRSAKLPLPVIVGSMLQAKKFVTFDSVSLKLAKKYWPGALTLILKKKNNIPSLLTAGKRNLALRVSGNLIAQSIALGLGGPLISTSANSSKEKECYSISMVRKQISNLNGLVSVIIDAGKLPSVVPSTIAQIKSNKIVTLRKGNITF
ncbi:MAG: L-threonylcarbamoyladenylate synthase [Patescibacteria group bacterium]